MNLLLASFTDCLGWPCMSDFSCCNYCAAQTKHMVLHGSVRMGDCLIMAMKKCSVFHFKGDMIIVWRLLVQMKCTEINGCVYMGDCCLLFSLWNQRHIRLNSLLLLWHSKRCMIVKYWFWKLKTSCFVWLSLKEYNNMNLKERPWGNCVRQSFAAEWR